MRDPEQVEAERVAKATAREAFNFLRGKMRDADLDLNQQITTTAVLGAALRLSLRHIPEAQRYFDMEIARICREFEKAKEDEFRQEHPPEEPI